MVSDPPLRVRLVAVTCVSWLRVPDIETAAKDWPAPSVIVLEAPVKDTEEDDAVKVAADEVSQEPAKLTVADENVTVAAPAEVRPPLNVGADEVSVRGAAKVRLPVNLVGMPPFSMFVSEVMVVSALATQSFASDTLHLGRFLTIIVAHDVRSLVIVTVFLLFAVALFGGFTYRVTSMVWGTAPEGVRRGEQWDVSHIPLLVTGAAIVGLGLGIPDPVKMLMDRAVAALLTVR